MTIDCADAVTMITGNLAVPVERLYTLYKEFLDDSLYTHVLPRAFRYSQPIVQEQLPELTGYLLSRKSQINEHTYQSIVGETRARFGDAFTIATAAQGWQSLDPLSEPVLKGKQVIVVDQGETE